MPGEGTDVGTDLRHLEDDPGLVQPVTKFLEGGEPVVVDVDEMPEALRMHVAVPQLVP